MTEYKNNNYIRSSVPNKKEIENLNQKTANEDNIEFQHLPEWPPINIDFNDICYNISDVNQETKTIIHGVSGKFRSNQLTAILGPSGSGKTTLLNILSEYRTKPTSGQININGKPRESKIFRKMSRYIMQNEELDQFVTVREAMMISANLKLGKMTLKKKNEIINEILENLRLDKSENTFGTKLSGGERKRLSIAMELIDNPPVLFLDEPTTGLDDLSSSQCINLLRRIAHAGRTVICSIHTPSAKIFQLFDNIYILSAGKCVYQGPSTNVLTYMESINLSCPTTYNPADFIIDVSCGEYGWEHVDKMVTTMQNGKYTWSSNGHQAIEQQDSFKNFEKFEMEFSETFLKNQTSWWTQFTILLRRMMIRMWRDKSYIKLKIGMHLFLAILLGCLYEGSGTDASKGLQNYGLAFAIMISYIYIPMMPVLSSFPSEFRLLKREHFNQWYKLGPYYFALIVARIPFMIIIGVVYLTIIYLMSSQPIELLRFGKMYLVAILTGLVSDSFGCVIGSRFNMVNGQFIGPASIAPMIVLASYGFGFGVKDIPLYIKISMNLSYLRHSIVGIMAALYENRPDSICPDEEVICLFRKSKTLLKIIGLDEAYYVTSILALTCFYIVFTIIAYWVIKTRLYSNSKKSKIVLYFELFFKKYLNFTSHRC